MFIAKVAQIKFAMSIWSKIGAWLRGEYTPEGKYLKEHGTGGFIKLRGEDGIIDSLVNQYTGAGLTGQQIAQNRFATSEREAAQAFEERMSNTAFQRQVADMQAAGVNPALMYGGAGSSGASTPSSSGMSGSGLNSPATMSDLMQLAMLKPTMENLRAQADNLRASAAERRQEAEYKRVLTKYQGLVNGRYNEITDTTIAQVKKLMQVSDADIDLKKSQKALTDTQQLIEAWRKNHQDDYFELDKALNKADVNLKDSQAALAKVQKLIADIERKYMHDYGMKMGTNEQLALVLGLCSIFGINANEKVQQIVQASKDAFSKVGNIMNDERGHFFEE